MCAKITLVYGANSYGKSTLCAILRSLGTNDAALVSGRTRVGGKAPPQVEILLDSSMTPTFRAA
jgi:AAA15 family ATPase/GTPase